MKFKQYWKEHISILKKMGIPLFFISLVTTSLDQLLNSLIRQEVLSMEGISYKLWFFGSLSLLNSILFPLLIIMIVLFCSQEQFKHLLLYLRQHFEQTLIEVLRATGKVSFWSLCFVIPGLIKYIQFSFLPIVVILDPIYAIGRRDALLTSKKQVNMIFWKISFLIFLFSFLFPLVLSQWEEKKMLLTHPFWALFFVFLDMNLIILFIQILIHLWEKTYESDISLERN